jgi:hypothetical protein
MPIRYEVRRWRDGLIPDAAEAVESPQRLSDDPGTSRRLLELVPEMRTSGRRRTDYARRSHNVSLSRMATTEITLPSRTR